MARKKSGGAEMGVLSSSYAAFGWLEMGVAVGFGFLLGELRRFVRRRAGFGIVAGSFGGSPTRGRGDREAKLVLCVRTDLKMQKGKIAAQCGHAVLGAFKEAQRIDPVGLQRWEEDAQPKIALAIKGTAQARSLEAAAYDLGLPTYQVIDAGRTQIAAGSMTVLAIGPGDADVVNRVTGHLKLL